MPATTEQLTKYEKIETFVKGFKLSGAAYKRVMALLHQEMNNGLRKQSHTMADIKMFPTFVRSLPDGSEKGEFLALDLGGTNFRVLLVRLQAVDIDIQSKTYLIPQRIMLGTGTQLFDHIADCIGKFVNEHNLTNHCLPLGFTFSFPCQQEGLAKARLSKWTKGFRCEGVVGEDICQLLQEALKRRTNCKVEIVAVVNDAVGTLMSAAHGDRNCEIGLILGTGCNACYMEYLDNVGTWKNDEDHHPKQVIINTEWGAFGDNGCLDFMRTEYDTELDTFSINPGKQIMEKMISGMYMGEIVRLVLERLTREGLLFRSVDRECALFERGRFYTKYVSEIESDTDEFFRNTKQVLDELHVESYTTEDCKIVKYVCTLISARAAFLAAAGLATLINRLNKQDMTIAVDGSLYRFHPRFHNLMCLKIKELVKPGLKFKLSLSHDGSGKGAALTAAVSLRLRNMKLGGASSSSGDSTSNIACETVKVMA
ncbi:hexokinase type 2-like isoform X1 [Biomphalaria glabrata]|uniref:Phosphotransferase n=1 Tax=Biomphalaria glabrata TaxID=6526 RepID=A0A9W2YQY0_BIOGL|nr:hexokinase type 2-like isoform X1 [Biomphalaria glabrata]